MVASMKNDLSYIAIGAFYFALLVAITLVLQDVYKRKDNCTVDITIDHIQVKGNNCNYILKR